MTEDRAGMEPELERLVEEARATYHDPPPVPRDEIWAGIAAGLKAEGSPVVMRRPGSVGGGRVWRLLAAGVVLAVGVGLGRWSVLEKGASTPLNETARAGEGPQATATMRFAALEHLSQTQRFLADLDTIQTPTDAVADWGRRLLTDTRLLLDGSRTGDPEMRRLLEDLELVLAQVVQLGGDRATETEKVEMEMLQDGLREQQMLPRIRRLLPPGIGADD